MNNYKVILLRTEGKKTFTNFNAVQFNGEVVNVLILS